MVNGGDIFEGWVVRNSQPYRLQTVWFEFEDSSNLVFKPGLVVVVVVVVVVPVVR